MEKNHWRKNTTSRITVVRIAVVRIALVCIALVCIAVSMAIGVSACGVGDGMSASTKDLTKQYRQEKEGQATAQDEKEPGSSQDAKQSAASSDAAQQPVSEEFAGAYTDFALSLLKQSMDTQSGMANTMVSPLSVMLALEMTRNGAAGETLSQMETTLYPGIAPELGMQGLLSFSQNLPDSENAHLSMANSIWFHTDSENFTVDEDFLKACAKDYDAQIYGAPFDENTLKDINRWVENETEGMVKDILDKIPQEAIMYLVNAVAFEAEWDDVYEERQVREAEFYLEDGSVAEVSMMYGEEYRYLEDDYAAGFLKSYSDGYDFVALLPEENMSLSEYVNQLDGSAFLQTIRNAEGTTVETGLPKFEAETSLELSKVLSGMGMPRAFSDAMAEFPKMGTVREGYNIYISRVLHKTYINVDELGTKAGAATVVEMVAESAECIEEEPKRVILDRPFLYAIVERESKLPIFIGVVENIGE